MRVLIEDDAGEVHVAREGVKASDIPELIVAAKRLDAERANDPEWLVFPIIAEV